MKVFHTLKPIYNANSKILILGSMSSIVSRNAGFYYVHKTNRFWRILEIVFNVWIVNPFLDSFYKDIFLYSTGVK